MPHREMNQTNDCVIDITCYTNPWVWLWHVMFDVAAKRRRSQTQTGSWKDIQTSPVGTGKVSAVVRMHYSLWSKSSTGDGMSLVQDIYFKFWLLLCGLFQIPLELVYTSAIVPVGQTGNGNNPAPVAVANVVTPPASTARTYSPTELQYVFNAVFNVIKPFSSWRQLLHGLNHWIIE